MSAEPNRLGAETVHSLRGRSIDRGRALRFSLNGREIAGFAGDTVLSAALANGIDTAGLRHGSPLALTEHFSPAVVPAAHIDQPEFALPMDRLPASNGAELLTLGVKTASANLTGFAATLRDLLSGPQRSLNHNFDALGGLPLPYADLPTTEQVEADVLVIGAGVAGMGAACAAAARGESVLVVDRRSAPGGDARFFGTLEGEETPDAMITRLMTEMAGLGNVRLMLRTEVFSLFEGLATAHRIEIDGGVARGRVLELKARKVVLACGALERMPIFSGNRLPGVLGAVAAFHRADLFGVWTGKSAAISTGVNAGYRLATQASNAGVTAIRLADPRMAPNSRFIEFAKAYGIKQAMGLVPLEAIGGKGRGPALSVRFAVAVEGAISEAPVFEVDQLLVAGGWQPQLTLWHMAGGRSLWNPVFSRLEPAGRMEDIALAGSAAGYRNASACVLSGEAAIAQLFGREHEPVDDTQLPAIYESEDAPLTVAPDSREARSPAYLDHGGSLTIRPGSADPERRTLPFGGQPRWSLADQARALSLGDVAAGVLLGAIPSTDPGPIVQERCVIPTDFVGVGAVPVPVVSDAAPDAVPAWLENRFGAKPQLWIIDADDGRSFDAGALLYPTTDKAEPSTAIGVVLRKAPTGKAGAVVLLGLADPQRGARLHVRERSGAVTARLIEPFGKSAPPAPEPDIVDLPPQPVAEPAIPVVPETPEIAPPRTVRVPSRRAGETHGTKELAPTG